MAVGVPGQLTGEATPVVEAATNAESSAAIPFGVMVKNGDTAGEIKAVSAANVKFAGILVHDSGLGRDNYLTEDGMLPGATGAILRRGRCLVQVEEAVDIGDPVRVRGVVAGEEVAGAFRTSADSTDCADISTFASWRSAADAAGIAEIEIDMTNAALSDPD